MDPLPLGAAIWDAGGGVMVIIKGIGTVFPVLKGSGEPFYVQPGSLPLVSWLQLFERVCVFSRQKKNQE